MAVAIIPSVGLGFQVRPEPLPMRRASGGKRSKRLRGEPAARNAKHGGSWAEGASQRARGGAPALALATQTGWPRLQARGAPHLGRGPKATPVTFDLRALSTYLGDHERGTCPSRR